MRSKGVERLMRLLLILLGIGIGLAVTQVALGLYYQKHPNPEDVPTWLPIAAYTGAGVVGGLVLLLLSRAILKHFTRLSSRMQKTFDKTLSELQLNPVDSVVGSVFNPDLHEAVMVEGEGDKEFISETLRPGYYYEGRLIRPAMVKVKKQ